MSNNAAANDRENSGDGKLSHANCMKKINLVYDQATSHQPALPCVVGVPTKCHVDRKRD